MSTQRSHTQQQQYSIRTPANAPSDFRSQIRRPSPCQLAGRRPQISERGAGAQPREEKIAPNVTPDTYTNASEPGSQGHRPGSPQHLQHYQLMTVPVSPRFLYHKGFASMVLLAFSATLEPPRAPRELVRHKTSSKVTMVFSFFVFCTLCRPIPCLVIPEKH